MDAADRLELHEIPGRYGDIIDRRDWDALGTIFTDDAVFDLTDVGARRCEGLADIQRFMDVEAAHPLTHLMTNVYADETPDGVRLHSRIIATLPDRRIGSAAYFDEVVRTDAGWRIQHRICTLHRRDEPIRSPWT